MVDREVAPDRILDHVQEDPWIVVETEDQEVVVATIVERITNQDLDLVIVEAVDVEGTETSEIIVTSVIIVVVDVDETEDGRGMVVVEEEVVLVVVSVVVNDDLIGVREVGLMTVSIVNVVPAIAIKVLTTTIKTRATEKLHHRQALVLKGLGRKVLKQMLHKTAEAERMKAWKRLKR